MAHCDWIKCIVPLFHHKIIHGGVRDRYASFVDFQNGKRDYQILETLRVEGSGSSTVSLRTVDAWDFFTSKEHAENDREVDDVAATVLRFAPFLPDDYVMSMCMGNGVPPQYKDSYFFVEISGNISKFFQGQSIYSVDNHNGLIVDFILACVKAFKLVPLASNVRLWRQGYLYPLELHYAENFRLDSEHSADSFIHSLVKCASLNGRGFRFDHGEKKCGFTAVQATSGRLERFSCYNKYYDLIQNKYGKPKFDDEALNQRLIEEARGIVRFENKIKSPWFRRHDIMTFYDLWKLYPNPSDLLYRKINAVQIGGKNVHNLELEKLRYDLPSHILPTFLMWLEGKSVHEIKVVLGRGSRNRSGDQKYYRASCYLRDHYSVNLKVRLSNADLNKPLHENIVPMIRVLEAKPCEPPQWMKDQGLIYQPSEHLLNSV